MDRKIVEYLRAKKSVREIMRILRVGERRVNKIRALAESYSYLNLETCLPAFPEALFPDGPDGRTIRASEADKQLLSRKEWIKERLLSGWHPITVYEKIGISIRRSSFYRFLHRHDLYGTGEKLRWRVFFFGFWFEKID